MQAQLLQHPAPASSCRTSAPLSVRHEVHGPVPRCEGKRVRVVDRGVLSGSWKAPVVCRSAIQHYSRSHLDDEFIAMQQALQQAMGQPEGTSHSGSTGLRTAAHLHHGHHHHASHSSHSSSGHAHDTHEHRASRGSRSEAAVAANPTTTHSPHAMHSHHSLSVAPPHTSVDAAPPPRVCSLGGPHDDPILTMQLLRAALREYSSAVLKVHGSQPGVLLDAVAMLHLLNQELGRGAGPHLVFKPLDTSRPRHTTPGAFLPADADAAPPRPGTTGGASAAAATFSATPPSAAAAPAVATAATAISPAAAAAASARAPQRPAAAVLPDAVSPADDAAAAAPSSEWPAATSVEPQGGRDTVLLLQRIADPAALLHTVPVTTTTAPRHPSGGGGGGGDSGVGSSWQAAQGAGGGDGSYNGSGKQAAQEAGSVRQQGEGGGGDSGLRSSVQAAQGTGGSTLQRGGDASGGGSAMLASEDETTPASAVAKSLFASHSLPLAAPVLTSAAAAHVTAAASVGDCAPPSASSSSPASPLSPAPSSPSSSPSSRASPLCPSSTSSPASPTSALSSPPSTSRPFPTSPHLPPSLPSAPSHASASEAWQLAHALADQLWEQRMCVQLRCEGPLKLGTAFKALKRARRLLRHQANMDMLVAPLITSDAGGHSICFNCYPTQDVASEDVQGTL